MGTLTASRVPPALVIGGGTSPSGKVKPLPGSYETMARTFRLLITVSQPNPPPREWETSTPGPVLLNNAATASAITLVSKGPIFGVIWRKNWFKDSASRGNWTPGKKSGQMPSRKKLNQYCSSGIAVILPGSVLRPAPPRRG